MQEYVTIHEFRSPPFRVAVRRYATGQQFRIVIITDRSTNAEQRSVEVECGGSHAARNLLKLLQSGAVMAEYLEQGGIFEFWN